jgi:undecaprenyl diphosphate synthase
VLRREVPKMVTDGVQLHVVGERAHLSDRIQQALLRSEQATAHCQRLVLNVCFNYGGRWDMVQAANRLMQKQQPMTEEALGAELALAHVPDPDLLIRTGGEHRLSNFLIWQCAYSELYFSDVLWPDFDEAHFNLALASFAQRERRFGMLSEQVAPSVEAVHGKPPLISC